MWSRAELGQGGKTLQLLLGCNVVVLIIAMKTKREF